MKMECLIAYTKYSSFGVTFYDNILTRKYKSIETLLPPRPPKRMRLWRLVCDACQQPLVPCTNALCLTPLNGLSSEWEWCEWTTVGRNKGHSIPE